MALGDSITQSAGGFASYRYFLYQQLLSQGYDVDFVGHQYDNFGGPPRWSDFDQWHEGYGGWHVAHFVPVIHELASDTQPDIVLVHIGTNDTLSSYPVATSIDELGTVIDELRDVNPAVSVLLAKVLPIFNRGVSVDPFNAAIEVLATERDTPTSRVLAVDLNTGFELNVHLGDDGLHPTEVGEELMAERWLGALSTLISPTQAPYSTYGIGCPSSVAVVPALLKRPGNKPAAGVSFTVDVLDLPEEALTVGILGFERDDWQGIPLPFELEFLGMTGCRLWLHPARVYTLGQAVNGTVSWTLNIPADPLLVGIEIFQQAAVVDPSANPFGLVLSNANAGVFQAN
jgi:hypothetical protein